MPNMKRCFFVWMILYLWPTAPPAAHGGTLVARWDFDNAGNLGLDTSGFGNHATTLAGVTQVAGAFPGSGAGFFDNAASTFTRSPMAGYDGTGGFTLAAWFRLDPTATPWDGIISQDDGACCQNRILVSPGFYPMINAHEHNDQHLNSVFLSTNQWYHIAMAVEAGGVAHVYLDGVEMVDSPRFLPPLTSSATFNTYLGKGEAGTAHPFKGALDDVRVYEGALTAAEVRDVLIRIPEPSSLILSLLVLTGLAVTLLRRQGRRGILRRGGCIGANRTAAAL